MLSVFIRSTLTDRSLRPLRARLAGLIPKGARLVEIGCANGRLLLEQAGRLDCGLGVDLDRSMITYARRQAERQGFDNLQFAHADALTMLDDLPFEPTHAMASLFLHTLWLPEGVATVKKLANCAPRVIIADLVEPDAVFQKAFLHFDEWLAGHRDLYLAYRDAGGLPALLEAAGLSVVETTPTPVPGVQVWVCSGESAAGG